ncbi:MAG: hypothetical protein Q7S06_02360 [Nanoarchaeota archaeon]|nr:hypothetical protein [Nanoarchaeota archaeon]
MKKRGVSEMIGYILLITIGIAMSIVVFTWLKGYVPKESAECSEGVSVFIKTYTYDCTAKKLTLEMKNNGRFSIAGYLIHGTTQPAQELATEDLSIFYAGTTFVGNGEIKFGSGASVKTNSFNPSSESNEQVITHNFDFLEPIANFSQIYSIEIVPTRYETIRSVAATCAKAKLKQELACSP